MTTQPAPCFVSTLNKLTASAYQANPKLITAWVNPIAGQHQINLIATQPVILNFLDRFKSLVEIVSSKTHQHGQITNVELRIGPLLTA